MYMITNLDKRDRKIEKRRIITYRGEKYCSRGEKHKTKEEIT